MQRLGRFEFRGQQRTHAFDTFLSRVNVVSRCPSSDGGGVWYTAICDLFEPCGVGQIPPTYTIGVEATQQNGHIVYTFSVAKRYY